MKLDLQFPEDKILLIDKGVPVTQICDKRDALKYGLPHTGPAYIDFADVPGAGGVNARITRSTKTVKELLDGRYAIIPLMSYGGGFNEKGEYTMPVHNSLLFDGNHIIGRLKPFTAAGNLFDFFGKEYIGVGIDQPIYNDKQLLYKVSRSSL